MVKLLFAAAVWLSASGIPAGEYTKAELTKHNLTSDCWIRIDSNIYDVTGYLETHKKFDYDIAKWCGKDSTTAFHTKDNKGKKHSRKAELILKKYLIGTIK